MGWLIGLAILLSGVGLGRFLSKRLRSAPKRRFVDLIDPESLLFSQPSLCDPLPELLPESPIATSGEAGILHEDGWLQTELRPSQAWLETERLTTEGREFAERHRVGLGFRDVFVHRPPSLSPDAGPSLQALGETVNSPVGRDLFITSAGTIYRVRDGFTVTLPGIGYFYGVASGGEIGSLGLGIVGPAPHEADLEVFARVASCCEVELVDWYRFQRIDLGDTLALRAWLTEIVLGNGAA